MNYIKKLELNDAAAAASIGEVESTVTELRAHLSSSKFRCGDSLDSYVNVNDVLARLATLSAHVARYYDERQPIAKKTPPTTFICDTGDGPRAIEAKTESAALKIYVEKRGFTSEMVGSRIYVYCRPAKEGESANPPGIDFWSTLPLPCAVYL